MEREVQYCTTDDGVRIAFYVEGTGQPLLLLPWFVESPSLDHLVPEAQAHDRLSATFLTCPLAQECVTSPRSYKRWAWNAFT
jgi:hypothetical protein